MAQFLRFSTFHHQLLLLTEFILSVCF